MRIWIFLLLAAAVAGCKNKTEPGGEVPPPVGAPVITCPATQVIEAIGLQTPVTYPAPVVTGGTPPVTTSCSMASGSPFPIGPTSISCDVRDQLNRTATCTFQVSVVVSLQLKGPNLLAFGDSITGGETSLPSFNDLTNAYPSILNQMLSERYFGQTVVVENCGRYGERANFGEGTARLQSVLGGGSCGPIIPAAPIPFSGPPDALLLLEGINDLSRGADERVVREALQTDIRNAKTAGVKGIFVATLLPLGSRPIVSSSLIQSTNNDIRALAAAEQVVLVDAFAAFAGRTSTLIGADSLHPTPAGHRVLAETFFAAIVANFEAPRPATAARRRAGR